ncbi:hypothetical protein GF342_03445 [Candidatus Woesearchaeota archaeon]|nr:hypothetical protein [Candidatus Woesearchaeota archaeon]
MPEKIDAASSEIKHVGVFDFDTLLSTVSKWMKGQLYGYLEKKHKYTADERELEIKGDKKINEYVKLYLVVEVEVSELEDVEVIIDQKKEIKKRGKIRIGIEGKMELDWMKRFEKGFYGSVQKFYHEYIIKHRIGQWKDMIDKDVYELSRAIRGALEMEL